MAQVKYSQPFRLTYPLSADQVEYLDQMLHELYLMGAQTTGGGGGGTGTVMRS
jgi:mevalonate kinase